MDVGYEVGVFISASQTMFGTHPSTRGQFLDMFRKFLSLQGYYPCLPRDNRHTVKHLSKQTHGLTDRWMTIPSALSTCFAKAYRYCGTLHTLQISVEEPSIVERCALHDQVVG